MKGVIKIEVIKIEGNAVHLKAHIYDEKRKKIVRDFGDKWLWGGDSININNIEFRDEFYLDA